MQYFGVSNAGDAGGLKKALKQGSLDVGEDALSESLFADLSRNGSGINLLI